MDVYQMRIAKPKKNRAATIPKPEIEQQSEPPIQPVQGIMPDSVEEWRFALALNQLGHTYIFQYKVLDFPLRGSQKIDFWVTSTVPYPTPVYIQGAFWHLGNRTAESTFKIAELKRIFKGRINEPVVIYDFEIPTMDDALRVARWRLR